MAEERLTDEAVRDPIKEWFIPIFGEDDHQQPEPEAKSKHPIPKAPAKFREYKQEKKYFDPRVVSLGPYHHGKDLLKPMEKYKITAAKQFVDDLKDETGGRGTIYKKFMELTGVWKGFYDAEMVPKRISDDAEMVTKRISDHDFARMMFLDGCFVLYFIENELPFDGRATMLEISNNLIPLIIRDMFLIENQLPFEVLDALINLRWGSISEGKEKILKFIEWKVFIPMGFFGIDHFIMAFLGLPIDQPLDERPFHGSLHLLDILRNILLDFPPSNGAENDSSEQRNFGSVTELKEIGIRFEKRYMQPLMDISFEEHLLFPRLLLPTMFINDTTISLLLNLTAFEMCSDIHSGCGVTSYIRFMDSLINHEADVKELRSKGILHHSLGSDDEVARLFNTWPGDVRNDIQLYSGISTQIFEHRNRKVKISIAKWLKKYFGSPWTAISFVAAVLLLVFTAIQTYFAAFS
ncbi:UPF0481 protein At3g47200-like [Magnolia sinica]|uniref:UPF0481 protein At3g47200-like n=1 Tax=Magnolia sinica TaxID=86752 RepID=UPI002658FCC1|nr:UPF0481 protein At3g47200-like [Magnolia sinica]